MRTKSLPQSSFVFIEGGAGSDSILEAFLSYPQMLSGHLPQGRHFLLDLEIRQGLFNSMIYLYQANLRKYLQVLYLW